MESTKYLIIGGGVAGTTASSTIRQHDPDGRIMIVEDEAHLLYSRVALPAYSRGKTIRERVFLKEPAFYQQQSIELLSNQRAVSLDADQKVVTLADGARITFEKLLIATGGSPRTWQVKGSQLAEVLPMRTLEHAEEIHRLVASAKHVVLVGGGFITLEHIQTLAEAGVRTTAIIREPYFWGSLIDQESGQLLQQIIDASSTTEFFYQTEVHEIVGDTKVSGVVLSNGKQLPADAVFVNIGIDLNTGWLEQTGIKLQRGVVVNEYLQTNIEGIFAAGDVALFYDPILNVHHHQGNWQNATTHGQVAGLNMVGKNQPIDSVSSYSISLFGKNVSFVGQTTPHSGMVVLPRGSARQGAYGRILIKEGLIVGATLINRFMDREPLRRLIAAQIDVSSKFGDLTDETLSIKDLADALIH